MLCKLYHSSTYHNSPSRHVFRISRRYQRRHGLAALCKIYARHHHDGCRYYRRGSARRPPDERHTQPRPQHEKDAVDQQPRKENARLRDNGSRNGDLYRQNRHPDKKPDERERCAVLL